MYQSSSGDETKHAYDYMNSKIRNALLIIIYEWSIFWIEYMYECMSIVHGNMTFCQFLFIYSSGISHIYIYKLIYLYLYILVFLCRYGPQKSDRSLWGYSYYGPWSHSPYHKQGFRGSSASLADMPAAGIKCLAPHWIRETYFDTFRYYNDTTRVF